MATKIEVPGSDRGLGWSPTLQQALSSDAGWLEGRSKEGAEIAAALRGMALNDAVTDRQATSAWIATLLGGDALNKGMNRTSGGAMWKILDVSGMKNAMGRVYSMNPVEVRSKRSSDGLTVEVSSRRFNASVHHDGRIVFRQGGVELEVVMTANGWISVRLGLTRPASTVWSPAATLEASYLAKETLEALDLAQASQVDEVARRIREFDLKSVPEGGSIEVYPGGGK